MIYWLPINACYDVLHQVSQLTYESFHEPSLNKTFQYTSGLQLKIDDLEGLTLHEIICLFYLLINLETCKHIKRYQLKYAPKRRRIIIKNTFDSDVSTRIVRRSKPRILSRRARSSHRSRFHSSHSYVYSSSNSISSR